MFLSRIQVYYQRILLNFAVKKNFLILMLQNAICDCIITAEGSEKAGFPAASVVFLKLIKIPHPPGRKKLVGSG